MENDRLRITLDQPEKVYMAGQTIKGDIFLNLQKRTKIRAIKVQVTGKGKCKWIEILRKNSTNDSGRSLFYSSREIYAHSEQSLSVFEPRGIEIGPGEHYFDFSMPLDWILPSSFKGSYGSIKYKLRIIIQRPWSFDERHIIPFTVIKHMPLPRGYRVNPSSLEKQITKTISLFGTRPITMLALLPEDFAVRGEPMRICATVTNDSTTNVEKLRFCVLQHITYYSHVPLRILKMETLTIASKETGAVHKKTERSFAHELLIPDTAQPTDDELSGVINVSYEIRVEAVLRGFFKNLVLTLPFKLYSNDADSVTTVSAARPPPSYPEIDESSYVNGVGNPFENSTAAIPVYPSLDSSIGSPTHSSIYSESSSITSTTSDSSAATLSPAVGGAALSYTSGSSSQFNSPSARASFRSSNVPYLPYSSSPLMIQSYPPPNMSPYSSVESPQYTLLAQMRTTPPPGVSTSSVSFLQPPQASGVHELPPSYEEIFGNPTAPSEAGK